MSGVLFAVAQAGAVERAVQAFEAEALATEVLAYADDMYIVGPAQSLQRASALLRLELRTLGLNIKILKRRPGCLIKTPDVYFRSSWWRKLWKNCQY